MRTQFYHTTKKPLRPTQGLAHTCKRVQLTKEACAVIKAHQREASHCYKKDLNEAWAQLNETTENIVATHHKSVCHVEGELHMGHSNMHMKCLKTNAWNAFCWKKNMSLKERGNDESMKYILAMTIFLTLFFSRLSN
jgi:hypothetical protein